MAANIDDITRTTQQGWDNFCKFFGLGTVAVVITLALMAIFLL
jgi:hypothetical protein